MHRTRFLALVVTALLCAAPLAAAAPRPYDLELLIQPPFRFLSRLGSMTVHVFPAGVSAENLLLSGFSRNGEKFVTVRAPLTRMYAEVALVDIGRILHAGRGQDEGKPQDGAFPLSPQRVSKNIAGLPAQRYHYVLGPAAWVDVWTTTALPMNPQFAAILNNAIDAFVPTFGSTVRKLPGTPVRVEINSQKFPHFVLLDAKSFQWNDQQAKEDLQLGSFYMRVPFTQLYSTAASKAK
jgi:hypothetical protein